MKLPPLLAPLIAAFAMTAQAAEPPIVDVYKNPACGCCGGWEKHLRDAGFSVKSHTMDDVSVMRRKLGMPQTYASCHIATVGKYLIEGHVPAADVRRLMREHPDAIGLAAPGMPSGSPGMESPTPASYDVLLITKTGEARTFQHHPAR